MKLYLLTVITLFLLAGTSFGFVIKAPESSLITTTEDSEINLYLFSELENERITLSILDSKPWMYLEESQPVLEPNKMIPIKLFLTPSNQVTLGTYKIVIGGTSSLTGETVKKEMFIAVQKGEGAIVEKTIITGDLTPNGEVEVRFYVMNDGQTTLQDVNLIANVIAPDGNVVQIRKVQERIDPGQTEIITDFLSLRQTAPPGEYKVEGILKRNDKIDYSFKQSFIVAERTIIKENEITNPIVFGIEKKVTIKNIGNKISGEVTYEDNLRFIDSLFYSGDKPYSSEGNTLTWLATGIAPGEEKVITYYINYSSLVFFLFAMSALVWFYVFKVRSLKIRKFMTKKRKIIGGEEYTMAIELKNKAGMADNAEIIDFVPSVFKVREASGLKPKITKSKIGTKIKWDIDKIHKGDIRILNYKIVPMFDVHGDVRLPRARIRFRSNNKRLIKKSNLPSLGVQEMSSSKPSSFSLPSFNLSFLRFKRSKM